MPGRVTEKIAKKDGMTILKHTSCRVVGWDLHVADRIQESGSERLLQYLPKVIYLKFDGAEWQIPGLPVGVWPLQPVA